ncbi:MAG TPA: MFS transporter [Polyangiaceae bacterium]|nr:MFS transporter [Polyangiaceae bacterium]
MTADSPVLLNQHARLTQAHYKILLVSWAGWVFDFYDLILFSFLLGPIGAELGLSRGRLSYVLGASLAATAVGGALFGFLSDHFGRKRTLQWTILAYSLGTLLCGFAVDLPTLLAFRIVTGLGVGGEWATGQTYVGETFPAPVRGRYGAFMQTGAPLGIALASVVGGFAAPVLGWRACFVLSFLPALLVVYIRRALPESDLWEKNRKRVGKGGPNRFAVLLSPAHRKFFLFALVLALFDMSAYWFTYSWLPSYLNEERHFSMTKSAAWILVTQAGGLAGYLSFGIFADHYGRRLAFSVYSVLMAVGLLMVTLFWGAIVAWPVLILFFMFLVGFGTGMFGGYGPLFAELFPTSIRSTAMGTAFNLARGVQFFTPVLITLIAEHYGLAGGISVAAMFALLAGAWIWVFPETRGLVLED